MCYGIGPEYILKKNLIIVRVRFSGGEGSGLIRGFLHRKPG